MAEQPAHPYADVPAGVPVWHYFHDRLLSISRRPLRSRIRTILAQKPPEEHALRLRLLAPVRGKLPEEVIETAKAWMEAYMRAANPGPRQPRGEWVIAEKAYEQALTKHAAAIEALHKQECPDCPWNGETIFTEKPTDGVDSSNP